MVTKDMTTAVRLDTATGATVHDRIVGVGADHRGLDALLLSAERDAPDAVLITDDEGASTATVLAARVRKLAAHLRLFDFAPGERALVVAGARSEAFVAMTALLGAGLEPALVPCDLSAMELAAHAVAADAVALIGPSAYGPLDLGETYLSAAAVAESIRMIGCQGPGPVDGAIDLSFAALDAMRDPGHRVAAGDNASHIATFAGPRSAPTIVRHRQAALFADALSLVEQARINPSKPLLSTIPPATLAGLVAGPFAALIGASGLLLHGPFDARRLLALCDREPGTHLVMPGQAGPLFADKTLAANISSLILVSRHQASGFVAPAATACERPVVDVYAFGEDHVVSQRRAADGVARPPARVGDPASASHAAGATSASLGSRLNQARAALETRVRDGA